MCVQFISGYISIICCFTIITIIIIIIIFSSLSRYINCSSRSKYCRGVKALWVWEIALTRFGLPIELHEPRSPSLSLKTPLTSRVLPSGTRLSPIAGAIQVCSVLDSLIMSRMTISRSQLITFIVSSTWRSFTFVIGALLNSSCSSVYSMSPFLSTIVGSIELDQCSNEKYVDERNDRIWNWG